MPLARPHFLKIFGLGAGLLMLSCSAGCDRSVGITVGEVTIPAPTIDQAVEKLRAAFSSFGTDTLRWHLMNEGLGPGHILHHRFPEESQAAYEEAMKWAKRVRAGEDFRDLIDELVQLTGREDESGYPLPPHPNALGAQVAAAVAVMENGDWTGPLQTRQGWEIILLQERFDEIRSRSNVIVRRLIFHVADELEQENAKNAWKSLPLSGDPEYLKALPAKFRRGRVIANLESS